MMWLVLVLAFAAVLAVAIIASLKVSQIKAEAALQAKALSVDTAVKALAEQLDKYHALLRAVEEDRSRKYGQLEAELKNTSESTSRLQETTLKLSNILGNVKLRGQWGERLAEDIISYAGLLEGVNYTKQQVNAAQTKPDFTFLLPDGHTVNMDVKFPLDNYLLLSNAQTPQAAEAYEKEFLRNVKDRIKEIQNRDYINPAQKTLDFVLLFIPNEQVFGFIQEKSPELMDIALSQKVVLCSPFTLYAMLSVIRQAYENFRYEKDLKEIIGLMEQFSKLYGAFKGRFEAMGEAVVKLNSLYSDIQEKNFKQLDTKLRHIEQYKKGQAVAEGVKESEDAM